MTNEVTFEDALNDTEAAKVFIEQQKKLIDNIENQLSAVGVKHQIDIVLGVYGYGRWLALEDCPDHWWGDISAGDWVSSSSTC